MQFLTWLGRIFSWPQLAGLCFQVAQGTLYASCSTCQIFVSSFPIETCSPWEKWWSSDRRGLRWCAAAFWAILWSLSRRPPAASAPLPAPVLHTRAIRVINREFSDRLTFFKHFANTISFQPAALRWDTCMNAIFLYQYVIISKRLFRIKSSRDNNDIMV